MIRKIYVHTYERARTNFLTFCLQVPLLVLVQQYVQRVEKMMLILNKHTRQSFEVGCSLVAIYI